MRWLGSRSGDVHAVLRFPQGTSYEAAFAEAKPWGEQFPGAHVRLEIGDEAAIDIPFPRRAQEGLATICREFLTGVHIGVAVFIPATAVTFMLLVLR